MLLATASFRIAPGKNGPALEYLHKVVKHIKSVTGTDYRVLSRLVGPAGHVVLSAEHKDAKEWDASRAKISADKAWQKMVTDAGTAGLFIPGSVETALWETL
jgi:hypothetical protein